MTTLDNHVNDKNLALVDSESTIYEFRVGSVSPPSNKLTQNLKMTKLFLMKMQFCHYINAQLSQGTERTAQKARYIVMHIKGHKDYQ